MKIQYKEILSINSVLNKCTSNKEFPAESMIKLLDLKQELQTQVEKYAKLFQEVMKQYGVKENNNQYNWQGYKDEEAISQKVDDLLNSPIEIKNTNFLDAANFIKIIPDGLNLSELGFMGRFLRKQEKEVPVNTPKKIN